MRTERKVDVVVKNPPYGDIPHSISFERMEPYMRSHPSFRHIPTGWIMAVARNKEGIIVRATRVDLELLKANFKGGISRKIARIDACDALEVSQDIVDNQLT